MHDTVGRYLQDVSQDATRCQSNRSRKRRRGRPLKKRAIEPMVTLLEATDVEAEDLNDYLLYTLPSQMSQMTTYTVHTTGG